jgi:hypothetical protein
LLFPKFYFKFKNKEVKMARRKRKRGGPRYKKVCISLPKRIYSVLNGIAMGDDRKINRLIKAILEEKLQESTVAELEAYISSAKRKKPKKKKQRVYPTRKL